MVVVQVGLGSARGARDRVGLGGGVRHRVDGVHAPVPADPADPLHAQDPEREVAEVEVGLGGRHGGYVGVARGLGELLGGPLGRAGERDAAAREHVLARVRIGHHEAGAAVAVEVAGVLREARHEQHRGAVVEAPVGHQRGPRIAVRAMGAERRHVGGGDQRAGLLGGRTARCRSGFRERRREYRDGSGDVVLECRRRSRCRSWD